MRKLLYRFGIGGSRTIDIIATRKQIRAAFKEGKGITYDKIKVMYMPFDNLFIFENGMRLVSPTSQEGFKDFLSDVRVDGKRVKPDYIYYRNKN